MIYKDIENYLAAPVDRLTENEHNELLQEYKFQRNKKITKIVTGAVASVAIGGFMLLAGLAGILTNPFMIMTVGICSLICGGVCGGLSFALGLGMGPSATQLSNGDTLTKAQLKSLKNKVKELSRYKGNFTNKTISYEEYKQQQGITSTQTSEQVKTDTQTYAASTNDNDLHL